ncbi:HlyD family secretion protein [Aurantimonas endophytica]|uniref:Membrane fusion protein (Multidrug efflux system) n=1 Tax=Aurantimonas endophytica TaxID=1522175 RepID=A0A7W6MPY4_9HYPH|nr:HlyD family secretion protein [Aurantimonas endophytica]MBB4003377.1 membrane fusion protein (multidrug efflux system) [Aurantimonas endophytica]MCO6404238.1 HlyD family efflux transporter periplasmic adaptor subunit [Aurantimonas endophytica]
MNVQPDKNRLNEAEPVVDPDVTPASQPSPAADAGPPEAATPAAEAAPPPEAAKKKRRPIRTLLIVALPLALALGGAYYWVTGGRYINTEDAYVQQDRVTVMPQVSGQIARVAVAENQKVEAGALLFTIDDSVYRNAVEQDQANLESARLNVEKLKAAYAQAVSEAGTARDALTNAETQDRRQQTLVQKGIVSQSTLDDADLALRQARGALSSAESQVLAARAALAGDPDIATDKHPLVLEAFAQLHAAQLDLSHTEVTAPAAGVISQTDRLLEGQYVTPASAVMSLMETHDSWIEANYKETELTDMRVGQPVDVELDTYPDHLLHATVGSIGAGTGSEFALLPAQNATGNWVKVVQRIPVRIRIAETDDMPSLRAGMSASVTVDTGHARGVPAFLAPVVAALGLDTYLPAGRAVAAKSGAEATDVIASGPDSQEGATAGTATTPAR